MNKLVTLSLGSLLTIMMALSGCGGKDSAHESTAPITPPPQTAVQNPQQPPAEPAPPSPTQVATGSPNNPNTNPKGNSKKPNPKGKANNTPGPVQAPPVCDSSGPIGTYSGYLTESDGKTRVPLTINIDIRMGATGGVIPLRTTLQIGLFGGVQLTTPDNGTYFTSDDGKLDATFAPAIPGGPTMELQGNIICGVFTNAQLHGKNNYQLTLSKGTKAPFDSRQVFKYGVQFEVQNDDQAKKGAKTYTEVKGIMSVSRQGGTQASSDFSDLPTIPNIITAFQFNPYTTVLTDWTHYDPLTGIFLVSLASGTRFVRCENVGLAKWAGDLSAPSMKCDLSAGASVIHKMLVAPTDKTMPPARRYFVGSLVPAVTGVMQPKAIAELYYSAADGPGINPPNFIFPNFPMLYLKIQVCGNGSTRNEVNFVSIAVDDFTSQATFRYAPTPTNILDFDGDFNFGWQAFQGNIHSILSSHGNQDSQFIFNQWVEKKDFGCGP